MSQAGRVTAIALAALVFGALFAGASVLFVRLSELGPISTAFHRVFLALPALVLWVAWAARALEPGAPSGHKPAGRREMLVLILAGLFFAGDLIFWHLAIIKTSVANATLLATLAPIYVTLGMFLFFGERPRGVFLLGMVMALAGAALLIWDNVAFRPERLEGDIYGLITGVFFGSYLITIGRLRARLSTAAVMLWSTSVTAAVLLPVAWVWEDGHILAVTLYGWGVMVALALISHVGGQGLIAFALAHLPTAFSSLTMLIEVVAAAFVGWAFLSEPLGLWQWLGGAIVLGGIVVARRGSAT